MLGIFKSALMSLFVLFIMRLSGLVSGNWDWWMFFIGIVGYARFSIFQYRYSFRKTMKVFLERFPTDFDDDQKELLIEASGIILPPKLFASEISRLEPASLCVWCEIVNIMLFVSSLFYGQYYISITSFALFVLGYGYWLWQPNCFYGCSHDMNTASAILLYLKHKGSKTKGLPKSFYEGMLIGYRITVDMFNYKYMNNKTELPS